MKTDDILTRIKELRAILAEHRRLYYVENAPSITDELYDALTCELAELEAAHPELVTPDSPTATVGSDLIPGWSRVRHESRMLSLANVYEGERSDLAPGGDMAELERWWRGLYTGKGPAAVVEPKVDGCAVALVYRSGRLESVSTRGDGDEGDDVTEAFLQACTSAPLTLPAGAPDLLEVYGEAYVPPCRLSGLNFSRRGAGLPEYKHPRQAVAAMLRTRRRESIVFPSFEFVAHGSNAAGIYRTWSKAKAKLREWGIPCVEGEPLDYFEAIRAEVRRVRDSRSDSLYPLDGVVVKVDSDQERRALGTTAHSPRWAVAVKFRELEQSSIITGITAQVSRTGRLTPVAQIRPVEFYGSTVKRVNLHSADHLIEQEYAIGQRVWVRMAGGVIPELRAAEPLHGREPFDLAIELGGVCPECGAPVVQDDLSSSLRCTNFTCPAQIEARLVHACSRAALDIPGVGPVVAAAIANLGIKTALDLYSLPYERLMNANTRERGHVRRLGAVKARKILEALRAARSLPLDRWLVAFSLPGIGPEKAREMAQKYRTLDRLVRAEVVPYFSTAAGQAMLRRLAEEDISPVQPFEERGGRLSSHVFVLTGTFTAPRRVMEALIRAEGGRVCSSISALTDIILAGEKPGRKLDEAIGRGMQVWTEEDLLTTLDPRNLD